MGSEGGLQAAADFKTLSAQQPKQNQDFSKPPSETDLSLMMSHDLLPASPSAEDQQQQQQQQG